MRNLNICQFPVREETKGLIGLLCFGASQKTLNEYDEKRRADKSFQAVSVALGLKTVLTQLI